MRDQKPQPAVGFTLIELLGVLTIVAVAMALALPSFMTMLYNSKLRSTAANFSGLLQNDRMLAVKHNRATTVHFRTVFSRMEAYLDANGNGGFDAGETVLLFPRGISKVAAPSGPGAPTTLDSTLGFTAQTGDPTFNVRGLPCAVSGSPPATTCNVGFVYYLTDARPLGQGGWAAVSITPAGRIKTWFWYGGTWGN